MSGTRASVLVNYNFMDLTKPIVIYGRTEFSQNKVIFITTDLFVVYTVKAVFIKIGRFQLDKIS